MRLLIIIFLALSIIPVFAQESQNDELNQKVVSLEQRIGFLEQTLIKFDEKENQTILIQTILAGSTITLVIITIITIKQNARFTKSQLNIAENQFKHAEKQLDLAEEERQHRYRAILDLIEVKTDIGKDDKGFFGKISANIKNSGIVDATNVRVHIVEPTTSIDLRSMIQREKEIKKSHYPITGSIIPRNSVTFPFHRFDRPNEGAFDVGVWIEFDYGDEEDHEKIYTYRIGGVNTFTRTAIFEHDDIERDRLEWDLLMHDK